MLKTLQFDRYLPSFLKIYYDKPIHTKRLFMIHFSDVMQRVKEILTLQSKREKIRDRDIAEALKLEPQYFAVIKKRKKIPYENLALFCKHTKVNLNWILLDESPQYI